MKLNSSIIFIGGLIIGAGTTYLALKSYFNNLVNSEIEAVKAYYDEKYSEVEEDLMYCNKSSDISEETAKEIADMVEDTPDDEEPDYDEIIKKLNYNQYSTKVNKSVVEKKPYLITADQYHDDIDFDKRMLSFFPDDEVVIDSETDEVIDDVGNSVGFDNLDAIGDGGYAEGEVYIRNEKFGTDYYVVLESGSYKDYIDGAL